MGSGIGRQLAAAFALAAIVLGPGLALASSPRAAERFRAAAAMQERALYDLAAAEFATLADESGSTPLAVRARLQQGVCLFQLARYTEAREVLASLDARSQAFAAAEVEQIYAYRGLTAFNLSRSANCPARNELLDAATESLDSQLAQFPNGTLAAQAAFYRAEALYDRGRLEAAVAGYHVVLEKYPAHPQRADALHALGVAEQELGRFESAGRTFKQFADEFPQHPFAADAERRRGDALLALAEEQLANSQPHAAASTLQQLLREYPESAVVPRALLDLAHAELVQGAAQAAEASLDECLARATERTVATEARLLRAQLRHARGDFAGGLADATAVLAVDARRTDALHVRGRCELGLQRPSEAARTLAKIVELEPNSPTLDRVLYDLAWALEESGAADQAIARYLQLAESCPRSPLVPESRYRLGEARFAAGEYAAAAECFQLALQDAQLGVLREQATHRLAWCHFNRQEFASAQGVFERQVAVDPNGPFAADARLLAAECRFQQRLYSAALKSFVAAIDDRVAGESLREMALEHASQAAAEVSDWPQSLALAERVLAEFPHGALTTESRFDRGVALHALGRLDEAERELTGVAAASRGLVGLRAELVLGQIHCARKQYDDAVRAYFKVAYGHGGTAAPVAYHHWQAEATYAAARTLEAAQRPEAARKLYEEIVEKYPGSERAAIARQSLEGPLHR